MAPFRQRTIYEVNADLSFFQMNEKSPCGGRSTRRGAWRSGRALLEADAAGTLRILDAEVPGAYPVAPSRRCGASSGPPGGSSPGPPSASPQTPNGTSRDYVWRSSARSRP